MENTLGNKQKFFAQYWGQHVLRSANWNSDGRPDYLSLVVNSSFFNEKSFVHFYLELKPLSSISDEDAINVARMAHGFRKGKNQPDWKVTRQKDILHVFGEYNLNDNYHISMMYDYGTVNANHNFPPTEEEKGESFKINVGEVHWNAAEVIGLYQIPDFLRSKGYAVPFMGISVDTLIEWGWVKLKEVNNG